MTQHALMMAIGLALLAGCSRAPQSHAPAVPLRVLCGSSMAAPAQALCSLFREQHSVEVLVDLGGSETLLPRILAGAPADIFICHDPFEEKIREAGRRAGSATLGALRPVLLVQPGNPLKIRSLRDLTNTNVKLGIGDPRYSTCGELFVAHLDKIGLRDRVMKQVALQGRTHAEIANGLILGPLNAVVVWNFVAVLYQGKVELVPTPDAYPQARITVVGLTQSGNPVLRDAFLELCRGEPARAIFARHGYAPGSAEGPGN